MNLYAITHVEQNATLHLQISFISCSTGPEALSDVADRGAHVVGVQFVLHFCSAFFTIPNFDDALSKPMSRGPPESTNSAGFLAIGWSLPVGPKIYSAPNPKKNLKSALTHCPGKTLENDFPEDFNIEARRLYVLVKRCCYRIFGPPCSYWKSDDLFLRSSNKNFKKKIDTTQQSFGDAK